MFELQTRSVKLTSVNPRAEIHGDKKVPAADLKFEYAADNGDLAHFAPELRTALYKAAEDQADMIDPGRLSVLKFPKMSGFKWDMAGKGYSLTVHYGIGGPSDIVLPADIDGFRLHPQNGGTVQVSFRAVVHPEEDQMGKLCSLVQQGVEITLTPPAPETIQQLFGDDDDSQDSDTDDDDGDE